MTKKSRLVIAASIAIVTLGASGVSLFLYQEQQYHYCMEERWKLGFAEEQALEGYRNMHNIELVNEVMSAKSNSGASRLICRSVSRAALVSLFK
jgi:hypothetical protein